MIIYGASATPAYLSYIYIYVISPIGNSTFCLKAGTTIIRKSTLRRDTGFLIDFKYPTPSSARRDAISGNYQTSCLCNGKEGGLFSEILHRCMYFRGDPGHVRHLRLRAEAIVVGAGSP